MAFIISLDYQTILIISGICGLVSFLSTYLVMPRLINKLKNADVVGKDIHKISRPIVAEMGGIGILFGFTIGMFLGIYAFPHIQYELIITLLVILLVGIVGMVDDLIMLSSKEKLILLFLAGLPLIWVAPPQVGILYLIMMPISVSIASNLTNMLAGLNGIESGLGSIAMISLTISCIIMGKYNVSIITIAMLGALLAFLMYNRHPSRVFPGDVGTLIIGACIAAVAFIGRVKLIALIILLPNIIDGILKFYSAGVVERQNHTPTKVREDGRLLVPDEGFKSLIRWILRKPMKERSVVIIVWAIGILFGFLGILIAYLIPFDPIYF
ncbi:MraY family glycosyltransferase [Methanobacterium alcaliphilum]|uniref:MraY family glycosyltransferase n=1 Tax=Methanobacterium alcaliphilum TaxID=392018 RepID=UPI00200B903F|nr:glycosyltransferase 4 family protein [Methanobacterium alcaliphilum]MCK9152485.1 multidrug transporter [Methanobacterium alcaliphilum]